MDCVLSPYVVIKHPDKCNLRKKGFALAQVPGCCPAEQGQLVILHPPLGSRGPWSSLLISPPFYSLWGPMKKCSLVMVGLPFQ